MHAHTPIGKQADSQAGRGVRWHATRGVLEVHAIGLCNWIPEGEEEEEENFPPVLQCASLGPRVWQGLGKRLPFGKGK